MRQSEINDNQRAAGGTIKEVKAVGDLWLPVTVQQV